MSTRLSLRTGPEAREQKRNKPKSTRAHWMNQTHRSRAQERRRACSTARQRTVVPRSGRRGRRFKSCHPDQRSGSLTCANAALRNPAFHPNPPIRRPKGTEKEHEGTLGKAGAELDRQKNTRPPSTAQQSPRAQQGPSGHSDPPSATKRPPGRNVRRPGITADPKSLGNPVTATAAGSQLAHCAGKLPNRTLNLHKMIVG